MHLQKDSWRVTLKDIAKKAGVSQPTVSAALHGRGRVGEERKRQIRKIARRMGYRPKVAAQLLRAKRTGQIEIIVGTRDIFHAAAIISFHTVIAHLAERFKSMNRRYFIEYFRQVENEEGKVPYLSAGGMADGTLLVGAVGARIQDWLSSNNCPWVSIEEPGEYSVITDADEGIAQVICELAKLGHRLIAYAGGPEEFALHRMSRQAFDKAVEKGDVRIRAEHWRQRFGDPLDRENVRQVYLWAKKLFAADERPTAVISIGADMARIIMHAALEGGIKIPQELSVVGFGPEPLSVVQYPPLTLLEADYPELTEQAIEILRKQIAGQPVENPQRLIRPRLLAGETIGPVRL
jgi:LacI family transcriptional regulator